MPRRLLINGSLEAFLGTLTSRYSDLNGYWLLGFLAKKRRSLEIDLRGTSATELSGSPEDLFADLAMRKFADQLSKWRVPDIWVLSARLDVLWSKEKQEGFVSGARRMGYEATFAASVKTDLGRTLSRAKHVFVAPHNPLIESRSARAA